MTAEENQFRSNYRVVIELPVQWGDMDALAHVNNVVYLRWFESGRLAYFERVSFMGRFKEDKIGPILASTEIRYRVPLEYPDGVLIGVKVKELGVDDLTQQYAIYSRSKNVVATTGLSRVVMYDFNKQKKIDIPQSIAYNIKALEQIK